MNKTPYIYANVSFNLANRSGRPGIARENWSFGKRGNATMADIMYSMTSRLVEFWIEALPETPTEEVNSQIKEVAHRLSGLQLEGIEDKS